MVPWQEEREGSDADGDEQVEVDDEDMDIGEDSDEESSSYMDSEEDDSSFDSGIDNEAARLMAALAPEQQEPTRTPQESWQDLVDSVAKGAALKVTDALVEWVKDTSNPTERVTLIEACVTELLEAIQTAPTLQHVILGRVFLSLLAGAQQTRLYQALTDRHASTLSFWKLGSDDSTAASGIATDALLQTMTIASWDALTEVEMRGVHLSTSSQINQIIQFIQRCPQIRQCNLLGLTLNDHILTTQVGLFDSLVKTVQVLPGFDELQLTVSNKRNNTIPLLTPTALRNMLTTKPKWWRLALDGVGLEDRHVEILSTALRGSGACKMNDLLSLQNNPGISDEGVQSLYTVCINKQRMGLVLSDYPAWVAKMDLVRPLNNLHRRLEYRTVDGYYTSRERWIEWLAVQANLPWIEDARKVNYLWFTLLEQPGLVKPDSA